MDTANGMVRMPKTNHSTLTNDVTIYQLLNHLETNQYMHDVAVKGKQRGWDPSFGRYHISMTVWNSHMESLAGNARTIGVLLIDCSCES